MSMQSTSALTASVLFDYKTNEPDELNIVHGENVFIVDKTDDPWYLINN